MPRRGAVVLALILGACGTDDAMTEHDEPPRALPGAYGVVEGFYGTPYTHRARLDLLRFLADAGLNTYLYAPKDDDHHRARWFDLYPDEDRARFGELAAEGDRLGVRVVYGIAPGLSFDPAREGRDQRALERKLESLHDAGLRHFSLLLDDIGPGTPGADPKIQTDLVIDTRAFLRGLDDGATLSFISNYYIGSAGEIEAGTTPFSTLFPTPSGSYYAEYRRIPPDVPILWTGRRVFADRLTVADTKAFRDYVGRPVVVWDNFPVNDTLLMNELVLGPYLGREPGIERILDGVLLNPMTQPEASKIGLWTAARRFALGADYDPSKALDEAMERASGGGGVDALRTLAGHFRSHPLVGDEDESTELAAAASRYFEAPAGEAARELRDLFARYERNERDIESLGNRALLDELREPSHKLSLLGAAGLLALDLLDRKARGETPDTAPLAAKIDEANAIRWHVGKNSVVPPSLGKMLAEREPKEADVFGDFFARAFAALE